MAPASPAVIGIRLARLIRDSSAFARHGVRTRKPGFPGLAKGDDELERQTIDQAVQPDQDRHHGAEEPHRAGADGHRLCQPGRDRVRAVPRLYRGAGEGRRRAAHPGGHLHRRQVPVRAQHRGHVGRQPDRPHAAADGCHPRSRLQAHPADSPSRARVRLLPVQGAAGGACRRPCASPTRRPAGSSRWRRSPTSWSSSATPPGGPGNPAATG